MTILTSKLNTVCRGLGWMTNRGFERLMQLVIEPQHLWKRYVVDILLFFYHVIKH